MGGATPAFIDQGGGIVCCYYIDWGLGYIGGGTLGGLTGKT